MYRTPPPQRPNSWGVPGPNDWDETGPPLSPDPDDPQDSPQDVEHDQRPSSALASLPSQPGFRAPAPPRASPRDNRSAGPSGIVRSGLPSPTSNFRRGPPTIASHVDSVPSLHSRNISSLSQAVPAPPSRPESRVPSVVPSLRSVSRGPSAHTVTDSLSSLHLSTLFAHSVSPVPYLVPAESPLRGMTPSISEFRAAPAAPLSAVPHPRVSPVSLASVHSARIPFRPPSVRVFPLHGPLPRPPHFMTPPIPAPPLPRHLPRPPSVVQAPPLRGPLPRPPSVVAQRAFIPCRPPSILAPQPYAPVRSFNGIDHDDSRASSPSSVFSIPHDRPVAFIPPAPPYINPPRYFTPQGIIPVAPIPAPLHVLPSIPSFSTASCKHIPELKGSENWGLWWRPVSDLAWQLRVFSHICPPVDQQGDAQYHINRIPSYPPLVDNPMDPEQVARLDHWQQMDTIAYQILSSRLAPIVAANVPSMADGTISTSRELYEYLLNLYGVGDSSGAYYLRRELRGYKCLNVRETSKYTTKWRTCLTTLRSSRANIDMQDVLMNFHDNLHPDPIFHDLRRRITDTVDYHPESATFEFFLHILQLADKDEKTWRTLNPGIRSQTRPPRNDNRNDPPAAPAPDAQRPAQTSYPPRRPFNNDRQRPGANQAHVAMDNIPEDGGEADADQGSSDIPTPDLAAIDDVDVNDEYLFTDYSFVTMSFGGDSLDPVGNSYFESAGDPFCAALLESTNTLADSGCTTHLFKDRSVFWTYRTDSSTTVKTANCGVLTTMGRGEVRFRVTCSGGRRVVVSLPDCLHAPSLPVNLVSVGALTERKMSVVFEDTVTTFHFPKDHPVLDGVYFTSPSRNHLTFMDVTILNAPSEDLSEAAFLSSLAPFPKPKLTSFHWHSRFGHPSHDVTHKALTKDLYVVAPQWTGKRDHYVCPPCLIGKHPAAPYHSRGNRAKNPLDLVILDIIGPMPVQSPRHEIYFLLMLDDATSIAEGDGLVRKSDALKVIKAIILRWENVTGRRVKVIRCDNALEFIAGDARVWFESHGISVQPVVPYAHAQNGKIERLNRTLEDRMMAVIVHSGLPMTFWADCFLAMVYCYNRLPTSTLSDATTPYETFHQNKPDISLLRVWGCQCFVHIPPELQRKMGGRMFEAIFVGYEEGLKGWIVRDLKGKYHKSRDISFNESRPGKLSSKDYFGDTPFRNLDLVPQESTDPTPRRVLRPRPAQVAKLAYYAVYAALESRHSAVGQSFPAWEALNDLSYLAFAEHIAPADSFSSLSDYEFLIDSHPNSFLTYSPSRRALPRVWDLTKPPLNHAEAAARPDSADWHSAMKEELASMESRDVFERTSLPAGRKPIGVRWVFAFKHDADGKVSSYKARLVAQGHRQRPDDYGETTAPVAKIVSIRTLLAFSARYNWELSSFDIKTAFLNAPLKEKVYLRQIPGFPEPDPNTVLSPKRALYGLKQ